MTGGDSRYSGAAVTPNRIGGVAESGSDEIVNTPLSVAGRLGQFLGLGIPAIAIVLELNHAISLGQMLMMLVAAVCCFWIGRILEGYARG